MACKTVLLPGLGALMRLEQSLRAMCGTGEIVSVAYDGGTQPGARRDLVPVSVDPPYLRAICLASQEVKTYMLDKMVVPPPAHAPEYRPGAVSERFASIESAAALVPESYRCDPYRVVVTADSILVNRKGVSGKWLKQPVAELTKIGSGESGRQYSVRGPFRGPQSYKTLDRAAEAFRLAITPPTEPEAQPPARRKQSPARTRRQPDAAIAEPPPSPPRGASAAPSLWQRVRAWFG